MADEAPVAAVKEDETPRGRDMEEYNKKFAKGGDRDISAGPLKSGRGCTDIICIPIFLLHWAAFIFVTVLGVADGDPRKLWAPRDFRGGFCGSGDNWINQDLDKHDKASYMMNVTEAVDVVAKQLVCSTLAKNNLESIWGASDTRYADYLCACCLTPCSSCVGSLDVADLTTGTGLASTISSRMTDLTTYTSGNVFSPSGANGAFFNDVFDQATRFFVRVCTTSCSASTPTANDTARQYTYTPFPDSAIYPAWRVLATDASVNVDIRNTISSSFTFNALSASECPYEPRYCVPFPGVEFEEIAGGYCAFKLTQAAIDAVGTVAAAAWEGLGINKVGESLVEEWGNWWGDFVDTLDAFALTAVSAFVIGLIFLVLLRFFVGCVVWTSILLVLLLLIFSGALCWVRHQQCLGASLWDSGKNSAVAVGIAATNVGSGSSEGYTGDGNDYRGVQTRTRSGRLCQAWDATSPHTSIFNSTNYPNDGLSDGDGNYCRNPGNEPRAPTIWCYTTSSDKVWEICSPVGAIAAECPEGFEVESETMRKVLEILAFVIWGLAIVWLILILCFCRTIMTAVAINKVAAMFIYNTPSILLVPIVQVVVGILWCLAWAYSAAFIFSQVPEDQVPSDFYQTYAEAYGTADTPGKCTDAFVNGDVYKYAGDMTLSDDPCSGNMGDTTGITPMCWRCFPPRYIVDWRVAVSVFSFLWNNAFLIALGQIIIACACAVWFFAPREEKTKQRSVRTAVWTSFRYHLGSIAFGSFIIALVQFIRAALMYVEKQAAAAKNKLAVIILKIAQYCMWCLEKCLKFLNKNAYIQIALLGKNFCSSAKAALFLILRNLARFGAVAFLGSIIHRVGIVFIVSATGVAGYFILKGLHEEVTPVLPLIVYIMMGYLVAQLYMNVFGLAVDTMLQCFIATEEMGGDTGHVPGPLRSLVDEKQADKDS